MKPASEILLGAYQAALQAAQPAHILPAYLEKILAHSANSRVLVLGAGKAAASMAQAFEEYVSQSYPQLNFDGLVITRYGHQLPTKKIKVIEAAHPVPDQAGYQAAQKTYELLNSLKPGDHLIALISGGGSSLLTLPVPTISVDDLRWVTKALLHCGAPIEEINVVRKHLSVLQGGHMARIAVSKGAKVDALLISDVTGDDPASIASGPCAADPSTYEDALLILRSYGLLQADFPESVIRHLEEGMRGIHPETSKPDDEIFQTTHNHVIASARQSLDAAAHYCQAQGLNTIVLGDTVMGEAKDVAYVHAAIAREFTLHQSPAQKPLVLLSGGECTVTLPKNAQGRGGRCSEFLLHFFDKTADLKHLAALAADTDGIDGSENNAGAWFDADIRELASCRNIRVRDYREQHDAFGFFEQLKGLVQTGPTLTNVNDFRIILIPD